MVSGSLIDIKILYFQITVNLYQIRDLIWEEIMANKCRSVGIQSICLEKLYKYLT